MKEFVLKISVTAESLEAAEVLRDEVAQGLEHGRDSGDLAGIEFGVGEVIELATSRIHQVMAVAQERHCFGSSDEIEIDPDAILSEGEDGPWIQGWLFVPKDLVPQDNEQKGEEG